MYKKYAWKSEIDLIMSKMNYKISFYDPYQFIDFDYAGDRIELVWRYNGIYYRAATKLYKAVNPEVSLQTFRKILKNPDRIIECRELHIQPVFIRKLEQVSYYASTDGVLLSSRTLSPLEYSLRHGYFSIVVNGESINGNRGFLTYDAFIGPIDDDEDISWRNDIKGDCSIGNLTRRSKVK